MKTKKKKTQKAIYQNEKRQIDKKIKKQIKRSREEQNPKKSKIKSFAIKTTILIFIIAIIYLLIANYIYSKKFSNIITQMSNITYSQIINEQGEVLEQIGSQKLRVQKVQMPEMVKNAYIAIEDERFYSHCGIDIKRTASAIASYIIHFGNSSFGRSTITQQLVKNYTGDDSSSISRKVSEWYRALIVESTFTKDEILENYLNYIYQGQGVYGVQSGAIYYFNKSIDQLALEEIAFLAGINISPNSYNPFEQGNEEKINRRTKVVLSQMLKLGYITQDEYNRAVNNVDAGLNFSNGTITLSNDISSYHTDALYSELLDDISSYYNISEKFAKNYLENANLTIVSTQNKEIQNQQDIEFNKSKYQISSSGELSQAAMVIIDHTTGYVLSCNGGLGQKDESKTYNRATMAKRQTGSSIKPLSVLMPGIDKKVFTASTIYDDTPQDFGEGWVVEDYASPLGSATVRRATESSQNVPFVHMMKDIGVSTSISYLKKLGITSINSNDETLVLALGGLDIGISPLEMASSYATIANDGVYIEPTFYKKVTTSDGEELKCNNQATRKVISQQTAYILKEILTSPVEGANGTATYCKINGVDVAAKTGTSDENYDRWLCGFTPYYTGVCWYGYDTNITVDFNGKNPAGLIWANVMSRIHNGLESKTFEMPSGITTCTICKETGMKALTGCTNTYTEYYLKGTEPSYCTAHSGNKVETSAQEKTLTNSTITYDNKEIDEKELQKDHVATDINQIISDAKDKLDNATSNITNSINNYTNSLNTNTSNSTNTQTNITNSNVSSSNTTNTVPEINNNNNDNGNNSNVNNNNSANNSNDENSASDPVEEIPEIEDNIEEETEQEIS